MRRPRVPAVYFKPRTPADLRKYWCARLLVHCLISHWERFKIFTQSIAFGRPFETPSWPNALSNASDISCGMSASTGTLGGGSVWVSCLREE
jgi:hypothetical protein